MLSFPALGVEQERVVRELLADVAVVGIEAEVKRHAIDLRRQMRLRLPDAIIAATAIALDAELLTNDAAMIQVATLKCRPLALKSD